MLKLKKHAGYFSLFFLVSCLCLQSIACQKNITPASKDPTGSFKVAIILPGRIDDGSWNQSAYEGLQATSERLNIATGYKANVDGFDEEAFRSFAREGYNFIIGYGGQYVQVMERIAKDYPQIYFAIATYYAGNNKNLGGITFRYEEIGYISGIIAALKSKTGRIGFIGGVPYSHLADLVDFFKKGARFINPSIYLDVKWLNSWQAIPLASDLTLEMTKQQIDVFMAVADEANFPILKTAQSQGAWSIGFVNDVYTSAPQSIITSCIQDASRLILESVLLAEKGQWEGKQYKFGFREDTLFLAPFRGSLSQEKQDLINKYIDQIIMGEIEIIKS